VIKPFRASSRIIPVNDENLLLVHIHLSGFEYSLEMDLFFRAIHVSCMNQDLRKKASSRCRYGRLFDSQIRLGCFPFMVGPDEDRKSDHSDDKSYCQCLCIFNQVHFCTDLPARGKMMSSIKGFVDSPYRKSCRVNYWKQIGQRNFGKIVPGASLENTPTIIYENTRPVYET
jgi:hypothetical protein